MKEAAVSRSTRSMERSGGEFKPVSKRYSVPPIRLSDADLAFLDESTESEASCASTQTQYLDDVPRDSMQLIAIRQLATVLVLVSLGVFLMLLTPLVTRVPVFGLLLLPFSFFVHDWIILHSSKLTRRFTPIINVKSMLASSSAYNPAFNEFFANPQFKNRVYNCCFYGPELNPDIPRTADEVSDNERKSPPTSEACESETKKQKKEKN